MAAPTEALGLKLRVKAPAIVISSSGGYAENWGNGADLPDVVSGE
ncbi:hypothetical protein [Methylobacter sp. YRD-M1]|nr:hypothetical protein [Methylobacter sp. YRD-M1]